MKRPSFTATTLRLTLSVSLFVIALLGGAIFYLADGQLTKVATDVSHSVVDANSSQHTVQNLQEVQNELQNDKDVIARANSIVADSQSYQYQDQIVSDLNDYANKSGIGITNIDFSEDSSTSSSSSSGSTSTTGGQAATPAAPTPTGVKSISVAVTLQNPVGYTNFLQFLQSIEDNPTKMQVQKIGLSKGTTGDGVSSDVLTIQVYIR